MLIHQTDVQAWDTKYRLKFINSISGYKAVHLIGSASADGHTNVAIFNSIVHIGFNPAQIGFIMRPLTVERNTYTNIIESEYFTINHENKSFLKNAHYTSANFEKDQSEFELCNLKEEFLDHFKAPFVAESKIKLGLKLVEDIEIPSNGCRLIIGSVELISIDEHYIDGDGQIDLEQAHDVCVTGLNQYSSVKKFINYPYARVEDAPNFYTKERSDSVVFDKTTQSYNSNILPYGTNISAPSIIPTGVSSWKNRSIGSFNHTFNNKVEQMKADYQKLIEEYDTNEMLYNAKMGFEPIIGKTYHLYSKDNVEEYFLSLIPPESWDRKHLGTFKLNSDKVWEELDLNTKSTNG